MAGLVVAFFWESFFAHKVLSLRDPCYSTLNFPQFVSRALKTNEFFPLWNPFLSHGKPYLADPVFPFFYPVHWLFYILPFSRALTLSYSFCVLAAGAFTFALARHWKFKLFPSLCAAVSLMFSTWMIATIEFPQHSAVFIWGPLELLIVSSLLERMRDPATAGLGRNFWRIVGLAVTMALQYLAGYPQMLLYAQLLVGLYLVARCAWLRDARLFGRMALAMALAGALTAGLCMVQFLPSLEFIRQSERGMAIDPGLNMASFPPKMLLTLLFPYLYGHPGYPQTYWGETMFEFWVGTCYIGIFPLIAATFSPFCLKRFQAGKEGNELHRFLFFFFCGIAGLGLVLAAGKYTPVFMALFDTVPGFSHFRWPSKFLVLDLYALAILAALGFQQLLEWRDGNPRPKAATAVLAVWALLLMLVAIGYLLSGPGFFEALTGGRFIPTPANFSATLADYGRGFLFLAASLALALAVCSGRISHKAAGWSAILLTFANLWLVSREIQPIMDEDIYELTPKTLHKPFEPLQPWQIYSVNENAGQYYYGNGNRELYQWGKDAAINNILQPWGLFQEHAVGLRLMRYIVLSGLLTQLDPPRQNRLADLMNIRYVVKSNRMEQVFWNNASREVEVLDRPTALPKAYLVDRWLPEPGFEQAVREILSPSFDPRREVALELQPGQPKPFEPAGSGSSNLGEVTRLHYQWNSVDLSVSATKQALLVLTDTWYSGWKATVNGKPVPIYLVNGLFRPVPVEAGVNEILFTYRPWTFTVGLTITLATVGLLALAGAAHGLYAFRSRNR